MPHTRKPQDQRPAQGDRNLARRLERVLREHHEALAYLDARERATPCSGFATSFEEPNGPNLARAGVI
jgi:hypothetical protein